MASITTGNAFWRTLESQAASTMQKSSNCLLLAAVLAYTCVVANADSNNANWSPKMFIIVGGSVAGAVLTVAAVIAVVVCMHSRRHPTRVANEDIESGAMDPAAKEEAVGPDQGSTRNQEQEQLVEHQQVEDMQGFQLSTMEGSLKAEQAHDLQVEDLEAAGEAAELADASVVAVTDKEENKKKKKKKKKKKDNSNRKSQDLNENAEP